MELAAFILDFILHVDRYLEAFVQNYGAWVYALLFLIIFVETGLVVMPFLPPDSLFSVVAAISNNPAISRSIRSGVPTLAVNMALSPNGASDRLRSLVAFIYSNVLI